MTVTGYVIIKSTVSVEGLEAQVLEHIAKGWQPTGGLVVAPDAEWTTIYMQAMVYNEPMQTTVRFEGSK